MNDQELKNNFIKVEQKKDCLSILVCHITWPHPHTPKPSWKEVATLSLTATAEQINTLCNDILANTKYFQVCRECQTRNPLGWMHSQEICQSCAEMNHGIVY